MKLIKDELMLQAPAIQRRDGMTVEISWDSYPEALRVPQAALLLQIGTNQMYELCRREDFPAVRFGRQFRISKTLLREWFEHQAKSRVANF